MVFLVNAISWNRFQLSSTFFIMKFSLFLLLPAVQAFAPAFQSRATRSSPVLSMSAVSGENLICIVRHVAHGHNTSARKGSFRPSFALQISACPFYDVPQSTSFIQNTPYLRSSFSNVAKLRGPPNLH